MLGGAGLDFPPSLTHAQSAPHASCLVSIRFLHLLFVCVDLPPRGFEQDLRCSFSKWRYLDGCDPIRTQAAATALKSTGGPSVAWRAGRLDGGPGNTTSVRAAPHLLPPLPQPPSWLCIAAAMLPQL